MQYVYNLNFNIFSQITGIESFPERFFKNSTKNQKFIKAVYYPTRVKINVLPIFHRTFFLLGSQKVGC